MKGRSVSLSYTVIACLPDEQMCDEYVRWLVNGHIDAVVAGGAIRAEVVRIVDPLRPFRVESRYEFPDRDAFDHYVQQTAPALRTDGIRRFPPESGVTFERRVGEFVGRASSGS